MERLYIHIDILYFTTCPGNSKWPSTTLKSVKPGEPGNVCM